MNDSAQGRIDQVFRLLNRELWVITAAADGQRGGLVATWVSQASIDPANPLVVVGLAPNHFTAELVERGYAFALHLLRADQIDLVWRFALGSGRTRDKLADLQLRSSAIGSPVLANCLAWLECQVIARYDAGDRIFFWADVVDGGQHSHETPLCEHEMIAQASDQQLQLLRADRLADLKVQRPLADHWRNMLARLQ